MTTQNSPGSPNRLLHPDRAVLLVIDIQEKFTPVIHKAERLIERTRIMIETARQLELPVVVSEQYPRGLGPTAKELAEILPENVTVLEKTAFGCLGDEDITAHLKSLGRDQIMVCGIEAHVCVNQTVHQLLAAGYEAHLIQDAVSAREKRNLGIGLAKMTQSGAIPSCTEMALFELMGNSLHPCFKPIQALIK